MISRITKHSLNFAPILTLAIALILMGIGCSSNSPTEGAENLNVNEDVAQSVAGNLSEDNGGVVDQIGDLVEMTGDGAAPAPKVASGETVNKEYDDVTGTWTITVSRERGSDVGLYYASISRIYTVQFRDQFGQPMQYRIVGGDTARTMAFTIVEGTGEHRTPRLSQALTGLSGSFIASDINTDTITINGTYFRSAVDTLVTRRARRTLDHSINWTVEDLRGPRGSRFDISEKLSGTITGSYEADITFESGRAYAERNVTRDVLILIENGEAVITVDGTMTLETEIRTGDPVS